MRNFHSLTRFSIQSALAFCCFTSVQAGKPLVEAEKKEEVPLDVFKASITGLTSSRMPLPHGGGVDQYMVEPSFEYTHRIPLTGPWYFAIGGSYEGFLFSDSAKGFPNSFQDVTGIIAVQYIVQNYVAMTVELRPGLYTGGDFNGDAFDIPVLVYAPIPVRSNLFLMIGARASGLQRWPVVPIGGVIWLINDHLRLEGVFPRPQLIYSLNDRWDWQIGGELAGNDFRMDRDPALAPKLRGAAVEYLEYRAGTGFTYKPRHGVTVTADAGYVFERSLNFFRAGEDFHSDGAAYARLQGTLEF